MEFSSTWLAKHRHLLEEVLRLSRLKHRKLYLVGGAVRDIFTQQEKTNPDFDFCLYRHAIPFARLVSRSLHAGFVVLDREHGCARVVKKDSGRTCTLDFSDFRGPTLEQDLAHRDFTFNSMALALDGLFSAPSLKERLIDPRGGRSDWEKKLVRMAGPRAFKEDPVRILRAFALCALFGLRIESRTRALLTKEKGSLRTVSPERIRDELVKILSSPGGSGVIRQLDRDRILELILPCIKGLRVFRKGRRFGLNVWGHSLKTFEQVEAIIRANRNPAVRAHLEREVSSGRRRLEILKLAALIHDVGKPRTYAVKNGKVSFHGHERLGSRMAGDLAQELKFSAEEQRILRKLVGLHLRPGYLVTNAALTARAKFRFFRDAQDEAIEVLLLALADERATTGYVLLDGIRGKYERVIPRLIRYYCSQKEHKSRPRLLDGNDLMREFGLPPGKFIGYLLKELEELQAIGRIRDRDEALAQAKELVKKG